MGVLLVPALLLATELILRAAGYACPPALFVPFDAAGGRTVHHTNRDYARPFFFKTYEGRRVPHGEPVDTYLAIPKPDDVVRIVFIGASTVEGFPHSHNLASSRFLERMLNDMVEPPVRVEVINLGISALASFPLIRLARDSLGAAPDLAVIYTGHNEFYGAYGVASLQSAFTGRWGMKLHAGLRRTRLYQALRAVFDADTDARAPLRKDLIAIMAARVFDGSDDPRYARAAETLRGNLSEIYRLFQNAGVPVVGCTLVCNERDIAPFASARLEAFLPPDVCARWRAHFEEGVNLRETDRAAALAAFDRARSLFDAHARLDYETARLKLADGAVEEARAMFLSAVDKDCMPWRAGRRANQAVRTAAADAGVALADVFSVFGDYMKGRPIGWELMADHLHPSVEGQALMAHAIAATIVENGLLGRLFSDGVERLRPLAAYRRELGDDPLVELATTVRAANFIASSPLGRNNNDGVAALIRRARRLLGRFDATIQTRMRSYVGLVEEGAAPFPQNVALSVAADCLRDKNLEGARHYFRIAALAAEPYTFERLEALTGSLVTRRKLGRPIGSEEVRSAIDEARIVLETTRRAGGEMYMARLWALAGDESRAADSVRRNAEGLSRQAHQRMAEEIRVLLTSTPTLQGRGP